MMEKGKEKSNSNDQRGYIGVKKIYREEKDRSSGRKEREYIGLDLLVPFRPSW